MDHGVASPARAARLRSPPPVAFTGTSRTARGTAGSGAEGLCPWGDEEGGGRSGFCVGIHADPEASTQSCPDAQATTTSTQCLDPRRARGDPRGDLPRRMRCGHRPASRRHRGSIGREIAANGGRAGYRAHAAQGRADHVARRPKRRWFEERPWLFDEVSALLATRCRPEQIATRFKRDHPEEPQWWVSHESIYQAIYVQAKGELRKELATYLRFGHTRRRARSPPRLEPERHRAHHRHGQHLDRDPHKCPTGPCPGIGRAT